MFKKFGSVLSVVGSLVLLASDGAAAAQLRFANSDGRSASSDGAAAAQLRFANSDGRSAGQVFALQGTLPDVAFSLGQSLSKASESEVVAGSESESVAIKVPGTAFALGQSLGKIVEPRLQETMDAVAVVNFTDIKQAAMTALGTGEESEPVPTTSEQIALALSGRSATTVAPRNIVDLVLAVLLGPPIIALLLYGYVYANERAE